MLLCLIALYALPLLPQSPALPVPDCPLASASCERRCPREMWLDNRTCPGGLRCCLPETRSKSTLRFSVGNSTFYYVKNGNSGRLQLRRELPATSNELSHDYSTWSYLRNRSLSRSNRLMSEEEYRNLGIELPVDLEAVRKRKNKYEDISLVEILEEEKPGDVGDDDSHSENGIGFFDYSNHMLKSTQEKEKKNKTNMSFDCGDAEDRLKCKRACPEGRQVLDRACPFGRMCCRGQPSGIFSPLRPVPFYRPSISSSPNQQFYNYIVSQKNDTEPVKVVTIDEAERNDIYSPGPAEGSLSNEENVLASKPTRRSVAYCKKYTELTKEYMHAMPLLPKRQKLVLPTENCLPLFLPLIVGGQNVTKGEFPHMAAISYEKDGYTDYLCGGTLVSNKYVLTAAHCVQTKWGPPVSVLLGANLLFSEEGMEIAVKRIISHPDYMPPSYYNDIALLELEEEVEFTDTVRPACLALPGTKAQEPNSIAIATGWGKTGFARQSSMTLKKVPLKVIENEICAKHYTSVIREPALLDGINDQLICATGHASEYDDTCQGDSGGPLQAFIPGHNCMLEIVAVTSFGKTCGTGIPGVYTRVEPYISWIEDIVWPCN